MQQIIHAIDHLSGHSHWRDQTAFDIGGQGRGVGLDFLKTPDKLDDQICLTGVVKRCEVPNLMDLLLDSGAPGINVSYARLLSKTAVSQIAGARISEEYGMLRCIVDEDMGERLCLAIEEHAEQRGLHDICATVNSVGRVATYVPGLKGLSCQRRSCHCGRGISNGVRPSSTLRLARPTRLSWPVLRLQK